MYIVTVRECGEEFVVLHATNQQALINGLNVWVHEKGVATDRETYGYDRLGLNTRGGASFTNPMYTLEEVRKIFANRKDEPTIRNTRTIALCGQEALDITITYIQPNTVIF